LYPAATVRRINAIKRLMASSYTIEDIQRRFSNYKQQIEEIEVALDVLLKGFEAEIAKPSLDSTSRRFLLQETANARKTANELVRQIVQIETQVLWPTKSTSSRESGSH
jgi:hypothetical protein